MDAGQVFGRSIAFPPRIGADGRWAWSEGADNIRESIQIILLTEAGERLLLNSFGGGLRRFLFEPNTAATRRLMQQRVQEALKLWEPRIAVQQVAVDPDPTDPHAATISVTYSLVATGAADQVRLGVNLGG